MQPSELRNLELWFAECGIAGYKLARLGSISQSMMSQYLSGVTPIPDRVVDKLLLVQRDIKKLAEVVASVPLSILRATDQADDA